MPPLIDDIGELLDSYTGRDKLVFAKISNMGVKNHGLVRHNRSELDLVALAQYIQRLNEHDTFSQPSGSQHLIKSCINIVKGLALSTLPPDAEGRSLLAKQLLPIEVFLQRVSTSLPSDRRQEFITTILEKFYSIISDPQSDASPATCVVLSVLRDDSDAAMARKWLRRLGEANDPAQVAGLRASLNCLYRWLCDWTCTPYTVDWVLGFIKCLEATDHVDILVEVSVDHIEKLFEVMVDTEQQMKGLSSIVLHVLASMREIPATLEKIAKHVRTVLEWLAGDSKQWTRQILQDTVDILTLMIDAQIRRLEKDPIALEEFHEKYVDVFECLESHMASKWSGYHYIKPWCPTHVPVKLPASPLQLTMKVGLTNLGNTCYMNSVMQALLLTRQFSNHVMKNISSSPSWASMSILFAKMVYSVSTEVNPEDFFNIVKPQFFARNQQHDSCEFLVHLLELLQGYESPGSESPKVAERPCSSKTLFAAVDCDAESGRASASSSSSGSSNSLKRLSDHQDGPHHKKRVCVDLGGRRNSFIQSMFGGIVLTRIVCKECQYTSVSRDMFRDLQLAFPEKPEGGQHTVQSLLDYYCATETLSGDNKYDCSDCGGLKDSERSVLIEVPPKYLILVLKHFRFEPKLQMQTKLMHSVFYNFTIHLPTVRSQTEHLKYQLYAQVVHSGTTLDSGHYYTVGIDNNQWHTYNDEHVKPSSQSDLNNLSRSCTPYILFYRRSDVEESAVPTIEELPCVVKESLQAHNKLFVEQLHKRQLTHCDS